MHEKIIKNTCKIAKKCGKTTATRPLTVYPVFSFLLSLPLDPAMLTFSYCPSCLRWLCGDLCFAGWPTLQSVPVYDADFPYASPHAASSQFQTWSHSIRRQHFTRIFHSIYCINTVAEKKNVNVRIFHKCHSHCVFQSAECIILHTVEWCHLTSNLATGLNSCRLRGS